MIITKNKTVGETVTENIKTAHIFKKYGIDFCCGGGISIDKACEKKNVDYSKLVEELQYVDKTKMAYDYDKWELGFLIDHIVNIHHTYVLEAIPLILQYSSRVAEVHGHHYKEVIDINAIFEAVSIELKAHLKNEETILFPYVKQMLKAKKEEVRIEASDFESVNAPITTMFEEHEGAGDALKKIAMLTNNYTPPQDACNTFMALYAKLEEFEQDLHQHIHLENNILFPKAIQLEQSL